jgi:hypothetical protein
LRPTHPRLLLLEDRLAELKQRSPADTVLQGYVAATLKRADAELSQPVAERVLTGPRLLSVSRKVQDRVGTLAFAYRWTRDTKYLKRAVQELQGVAKFSDWNPSHFLDVAEMTFAFALGYDWLYSALTPSERTVVREAIRKHGLAPARAAYEAKAWWTVSANNWNQVCNGGISAGALAVADPLPGDDAPVREARWLLARTLKNLPLALDSYGPNGGWIEGPGYWSYATTFSVFAIASLKSALGTDFGLSSRPGFSLAGDFRIQSVGPSGKFFNFADAGEQPSRDPTLYWLADRFGRPEYAQFQRKAAGASGSLFDIVYYSTHGTPKDLEKLPANSQFDRIEVAYLRGKHSDPDTTFVGLKGGDARAAHGHLDLGTFVLDSLGQRWAIDLGNDEYNLPGYFGAQRWTYYRMKTEGHNTLMFESQNQALDSKAEVVAFSPGRQPFGIVDLKDTYDHLGVTSQQRGIALLSDQRRVVFADEWAASKSLKATWTWHTRAAVTIQGDTVTLKQGNEELALTLVEPKGVPWKLESLPLTEAEKPALGAQRLVIRTAAKTSGRFVVLAVPKGASTTPPSVRPLSAWKSQGPTGG